MSTIETTPNAPSRDERPVESPRSLASRMLAEVPRYAILIIFAAIFLAPIFWVWSSALKSSIEIAQNPYALPRDWLWSNLERAWTIGRFDRYLGNTAIYCAAIVSGVVVLSSMAGYALAQLPIPARGGIMTLFLLGLMVPFQSVMIPIYYLLRDIHLLETYWAFIIPGIALRLPFGIFLMRGFFRGLPRDLADAARLDGAGEWAVFRQVMLPLAVPGMSTLVIFQFINTWNQFLMPLVFVQRDALRPVSLGTMFFFGRFTSDRGMIAAGVTLSMMPMIALYLLLQRRFIEGITAGAMKT